MLDFTLQKYKELCDSINSSPYEPLTMVKYLTLPGLPDSFIILRHDVDRKPERAEKMASIENEIGFKSTYYFRKNRHVFKPDIIKRIYKMGHEIGYHYEVLDKAKGNIEKAYSIFNEELKAFRDIVDVKTVSMHGNPLSRWVNSDFWESYSLEEFSLIGDASLSIKGKGMPYFTDTGRNWDPLRYNIKDFISVNKKIVHNKVQKTDDLINLIAKLNDESPLYLSIHPNRWNDVALSWAFQFAEDSLVNLVKLIINLLHRSSFLKTHGL